MKKGNLFIGYDIGSSSVKAQLWDAEAGESIGSCFSPETEMKILSPEPGFAEQEPDWWWEHLIICTRKILQTPGCSPQDIRGIGISYQMHGLTAVDKNNKPVRPAIIWCDSRAVEIGQKAFSEIGTKYCLSHLLNSPGNFTASKLAWIKKHEPENYKKICKIMLPGDYIAYKLSGRVTTTPGGLSEGIFWDFQKDTISEKIMNYFGFSETIFPEIYPSLSIQAEVSQKASQETGLPAGIPISYRAGDQPNNAFSLNALNPGEVAATAGTSGVVYAVTDKPDYDPASRVNHFLHVNHSAEAARFGVLLCVNGTGILNSWVKQQIAPELSYNEMDHLAQTIRPGSEGLFTFPYGNGAERSLHNKEPGAAFQGLRFNIHSRPHIFRSVQEGIVFAFMYGMDIMKETGFQINAIKAGAANMFLSPVFRKVFATVSGVPVVLYNTDGALGAARGAAIGSGYFRNFKEAFHDLKTIEQTDPEPENIKTYQDIYGKWKELLKNYTK